jgi:hypothetical protein
MASASLCSSYGCPAGPSQDCDYAGSETLRSIVTGALSISGSLSISPSGIAQRRTPAPSLQQQQQRGAATPALQQMLPQLPLPVLCGTPVQLSDGLPLSPTGATWQDAYCAAAVAARSSSSIDAASCKHPTSIRPGARRCLCLSLTQQHDDVPVAAAPAPAAAALPPVPPFTPHPSNRSSMPGSALSAAPTAAAPTAHGGSSSCSSSSVLCSHGSSNRNRLQAWLSRMELQLQVSQAASCCMWHLLCSTVIVDRNFVTAMVHEGPSPLLIRSAAPC